LKVNSGLRLHGAGFLASATSGPISGESLPYLIRRAMEAGCGRASRSFLDQFLVRGLRARWRVMDGIDAARHIRARAPILVIYLSAYTDTLTVARACQTAPAGYVVKPVPNHALRVALAQALQGPPTSGWDRHQGPPARPPRHRGGPVSPCALGDLALQAGGVSRVRGA
jgi:CheY-like chemotaxis protein